MSIPYLKTLCRKIAILLALSLFASTLFFQPASQAAVAQCGNRQQMVVILDKKFKETRLAMGLISNVSMLELFVSKTGTWTILSTQTNGRTCIVAAGKSWITMPAKVTGEGVSF